MDKQDRLGSKNKKQMDTLECYFYICIMMVPKGCRLSCVVLDVYKHSKLQPQTANSLSLRETGTGG